MSTIERALKDFLSFKFLMFSLVPLAISVILLLLIVSYVNHLITSIDLGEENFQFLFGMVVYYILHVLFMLIGGLAGLFSTLYGWHLAVIFAMFITSFLTPYIVACINKKHYNYLKQSNVSFWRVLLRQLGFCLKALCFLLPSCLFLLIPIFGVIVGPFLLSAVFFYLYFNFMITDVSSNVLCEQDFMRFNPYRRDYLVPCFIYYLLCNIPYVGFFLQVFFIIHLAHLIYERELFSKHLRLDIAQ